LTSDGRLVDTSEIEESTKITFEQALEKIKGANKLLDNEATNFLLNIASSNRYTIDGYWVEYKIKDNADSLPEEEKYTDTIRYYLTQIREVSTYGEAVICRISKSEREHYIIIPDNITGTCYSKYLYGSCKINIVNELIKKLRGTLKIIGGKNIEAHEIFYNIKASRIDLKYFIPDNTVTKLGGLDGLFEQRDTSSNINRIFKGCKSKILNANEFVLKEMESELKKREEERKRQEEENKRSKRITLRAVIDDDYNIINNIDSNSVNQYTFITVDGNSNKQNYTFEQLKNLIINGYNAINFNLNIDNNSVEYNKSQYNENNITVNEHKISNILNKAKVIGMCKEIKTECNHTCYLISKNNTEHILYIPDDVTHLNNKYGETTFTKYINELEGNLIVVGGHNIKNAIALFKGCKAKYINLSLFDTSNIENMEGMFSGCKTQLLNLSNFNTSNVTKMRRMFENCEASQFNLMSFDTSKVTDMSIMFAGCYNCIALNLSSFDTRQVRSVAEMFSDTKFEYINLSSFDTHNIQDTWKFITHNATIKKGPKYTWR